MLQKHFDFIIVGAGSAGCALANRLTRDPAVRVLLLEAGGWDHDLMIDLPIGIKPMTDKKLYRWNDVSEPDPGLNGRVNEIPHGKVIGGGSSINYMAHTRGHPVDYERWVSAGAYGWSYNDLLPYFKECEAWEGGEDAWRGGSGEIGAQSGRIDDPICAAWFAALRSLGYPITEDHNGEQPEGFAIVQYSIKNGRRSSSAKAFLRPALSRNNLTVQTDSTVTRIRLDGKRATGVDYSLRGELWTASAGRVVLCLGAINTPHLLMLSGVGPADHLSSMGIKPLVNLPVGKGLEDHLGVPMAWTRREPGSFHRSLRGDRAALNLARSILFRTGPSSRIPGAVLGFFKSQPDLKQPDLQAYLHLPPPTADVWFPGLKPSYQDMLAARVNLLGQKSRGEVLLRSKDPNDRPRVIYNSLNEPDDLQALRAGFRKTWDMLSATELAGFRGEPLLPQRELQADGEIDAFIRANAMQLYHPGCTCKMGAGDAAVLNPDLGVQGVEGLSVVDASVMPNLVSGNPNIPIITMATKAAAMWMGDLPRGVRGG